MGEGGHDQTNAKLPQAMEDSRRAPNVAYKFKIMVGFVQILTSSSFQKGTSWPSYYQSFIQTFSFVNFDFIPWQTVSCLTEITYLTKTVIVGLLPIGLTIFVLSAFILPMYLFDKYDMADLDFKRR